MTAQFGRICAIVVTYNIGKPFEDNFASLKSQVDHVVIIDNGSGEETLKTLDKLKATNPGFIDIVMNPENGLAKAQNIGIRVAIELGYDWVLLLDHDSKLDDNMVAELKKAYHSTEHPERIGIIAPFVKDFNAERNPSYLKSWMGVWFRRTQFNGHPVIDNIICVNASGSLIPTSVFRKVGFMDENLFIDFVDTDFCLRLVARDYNIIAVKHAVLNHCLGELKDHNLFGLRVMTTNHSPLRRYYIYRNRLKIWGRYLFSVPTFVIFDAIRMMYELFRIVFFEEDKQNKLLYIYDGVKDAFVGICGERPRTYP